MSIFGDSIIVCQLEHKIVFLISVSNHGLGPFAIIWSEPKNIQAAILNVLWLIMGTIQLDINTHCMWLCNLLQIPHVLGPNIQKYMTYISGGKKNISAIAWGKNLHFEFVDQHIDGSPTVPNFHYIVQRSCCRHFSEILI